MVSVAQGVELLENHWFCNGFGRPMGGIVEKQSISFDINYLTKLYDKSSKGEYELSMLKQADEPELQSAWLETFLEKQTCLECTGKLDSKGVCSDCDTS